MPRSENQKAKLFYLFSYLTENTDETHTVTMQQILQHLEKQGISAERKSIYDDIRVLQGLGFQINYRKEPPAGYCLSARSFSLPDLKTLADSVSAAPFLTPYRRKVLVNKVRGLGSIYEAAELDRPVFLPDEGRPSCRYRPEDADLLYQAIREDRMVEGEQSRWETDRENRFARVWEPFRLSPFEICFACGCFFLLAYDEESDVFVKIRLDHLRSIRMTEQPRAGAGKFEFCYSDPNLRLFSLQAEGTSEVVSLAFSSAAINRAVDELGKEMPMRLSEEREIILRIRTVPDDAFFGWVLSQGGGVRIKAPDRVVRKMKRYLDEIRKLYR